MRIEYDHCDQQLQQGSSAMASVDLAALWDNYCRQEFQIRNVNPTIVAEPDVNHIPTTLPCPETTSVAVLLGLIEFGPNYAIVKFIRTLGKTAEELVEIGKRLGHEVSIDKAREWLENPGESWHRSDPGRFFDKLKCGFC
jgi:hypothetical protein